MREIRPYGSVRGVRRNPYPYRDHPSSGAKHRVLRARRIPAPAPPTYGSLRGPAMRGETDSGSTASVPSGIGKRFRSHAQRKTLPFLRPPGSPCEHRSSSLAIGKGPAPDPALPASFGTPQSSGIHTPDIAGQVVRETPNEGRIHSPLPAPDRGDIRLLPRRATPAE